MGKLFTYMYPPKLPKGSSMDHTLSVWARNSIFTPIALMKQFLGFWVPCWLGKKLEHVLCCFGMHLYSWFTVYGKIVQVIDLKCPVRSRPVFNSIVSKPLMFGLITYDWQNKETCCCFPFLILPT